MKPEESGFAMADTLVALIITSLFATSLITAMGMTSSASRAAQNRLSAAILAREILQNDTLVPAGQVERYGVLFSWTAEETSEDGTSSGKVELKTRIVRVQWGAEERARYQLVRLEGQTP